MDAFERAIETFFAAGSFFKTAIGGRLYFVEAPQFETFPYCVWSIVSDVYDFQFVEDFRQLRLQFDLYSDSEVGPGEIEDLYDKLDLWLNWAEDSLSVSAHKVIYIRRDSSRGPYRDENKIWCRSVDYIAYLEKTSTASASTSPSASSSLSISPSASRSPSASASPSASKSPSASPSPTPGP